MTQINTVPVQPTSIQTAAGIQRSLTSLVGEAEALTIDLKGSEELVSAIETASTKTVDTDKLESFLDEGTKKKVAVTAVQLAFIAGAIGVASIGGVIAGIGGAIIGVPAAISFIGYLTTPGSEMLSDGYR